MGHFFNIEVLQYSSEISFAVYVIVMPYKICMCKINLRKYMSPALLSQPVQFMRVCVDMGAFVNSCVTLSM